MVSYFKGGMHLKTGSWGDENGEWRRLHNEEIQSLYRSSNIVRVNNSRRQGWTGHVARIEESRSAFKILRGTLAGKRLLGRPRRRWEDNIRIYHKKIRNSTRNLFDSAQDSDYYRALVSEALNLRVWWAMESASKFVWSPYCPLRDFNYTKILNSGGEMLAKFLPH